MAVGVDNKDGAYETLACGHTDSRRPLARWHGRVDDPRARRDDIAMPNPEPTGRVQELTRAFHVAMELGAAHLRSAVDADPDSADRCELLQLARAELAIAVRMIDAQRALLPRSAAGLADRRVLKSIATLRAIADEMEGPFGDGGAAA